jgi:hypothetical protein
MKMRIEHKGCTITNRGKLGSRTHELKSSTQVSTITAYPKGENIYQIDYGECPVQNGSRPFSINKNISYEKYMVPDSEMED